MQFVSVSLQITCSKVIVDKSSSDNEVRVSGSTSAYTFKNLLSNTLYSFVVIPVNNAGAGSKHIDPVIEKTIPGK